MGAFMAVAMAVGGEFHPAAVEAGENFFAPLGLHHRVNRVGHGMGIIGRAGRLRPDDAVSVERRQAGGQLDKLFGCGDGGQRIFERKGWALQ